MQKTTWISITIVLLIITGVIAWNLSQENLPQKDTTVSWDKAVKILNSGKVDSVMQTHSGEVTLTLEDGTRVHTQEPGIDDIFHEIDKCGKPCDDVVMITE